MHTKHFQEAFSHPPEMIRHVNRNIHLAYFAILPVHLKWPVSVKTSDKTRVDLTVSVKRASGVSAAEGLFIHCAYNSKRKWRHESRSTPDEAR